MTHSKSIGAICKSYIDHSRRRWREKEKEKRKRVKYEEQKCRADGEKIATWYYDCESSSLSM